AFRSKLSSDSLSGLHVLSPVGRGKMPVSFEKHSGGVPHRQDNVTSVTDYVDEPCPWEKILHVMSFDAGEGGSLVAPVALTVALGNGFEDGLDHASVRSRLYSSEQLSFGEA